MFDLAFNENKKNSSLFLKNKIINKLQKFETQDFQVPAILFCIMKESGSFQITQYLRTYTWKFIFHNELFQIKTKNNTLSRVAKCCLCFINKIKTNKLIVDIKK